MFGVEPICKILTSHGLKIATSTYYAAEKRRSRARAVRNTEPKTLISRVRADNFSVYGVRKVWRQLHHEGVPVARCTVARLMRALCPKGVRRVRSIRTTIRDGGQERADDLLQRDFTASRPMSGGRFALRLHLVGIVYVAFVIDVLSRAIVGWSTATSKRAKLVLRPRYGPICAATAPETPPGLGPRRCPRRLSASHVSSSAAARSGWISSTR
ncbi:IS3 family transposase [Streptomyces misionensis]|uniref:IS3 family transposase n=1 Tax=Streptomyces misionensis TaxID=67331 RepID=UPI00369C3B36